MDKVPTNKRGLVTSQDVSLDKEYIEWIHELKSRFRNSQNEQICKYTEPNHVGHRLMIRKQQRSFGGGRFFGKGKAYEKDCIVITCFDHDPYDSGMLE